MPIWKHHISKRGFPNSHHESPVRVYHKEEAAHEVHDDVEVHHEDYAADLHEPRAVEVVPLNQHEAKVEAGEEGSEDYCGNKDWQRSDIEKAVEDPAEVDLGDKIFSEKRCSTEMVSLRDINCIKLGPPMDKTHQSQSVISLLKTGAICPFE